MTTQHTDEMREEFEKRFPTPKEGQTLNEIMIHRAIYLGWQAATASADAKYLPVIEKLVEAIHKQQKQLRILIPQAGIVNDERMALMAGDEALDLAAPLLKEKV